MVREKKTSSTCVAAKKGISKDVFAANKPSLTCTVICYPDTDYSSITSYSSTLHHSRKKYLKTKQGLFLLFLNYLPLAIKELLTIPVIKRFFQSVFSVSLRLITFLLRR